MAKSDLDTEASLADLFSVLRQMRARAKLTQQQIAEASGAGGRHGSKLIARLEAGHIPNPSTRLVLDYLRACRATSQDLVEFLDTYLGVLLPTPARHKRRPRVPKPTPDDLALLALRREAAWWNLRKVVEAMLHHELTGLGAKPMSEERKLAAEYGRKVFRILYQTRQLRPALRVRRLKRCRAWAERKNLPVEIIDYLNKAVANLFEDVKAQGALDWLPTASQARQLMLLPPRHRLVTDYDLCRREFLAQQHDEHNAREEARKPVIEAALSMLRSSGLSEQKIANYRSIITAFLNVAETTQPSSAARERGVVSIISVHQQPYIDQAILRRLADLVFSLRA